MRKFFIDGERLLIITDEPELKDFLLQGLQSKPGEEIKVPLLPQTMTMNSDAKSTPTSSVPSVNIKELMELYESCEKMDAESREAAKVKIKAGLAEYLDMVSALNSTGKQKLIKMSKEIRPFMKKTIKQIESEHNCDRFPELMKMNLDFEFMCSEAIKHMRTRIV